MKKLLLIFIALFVTNFSQNHKLAVISNLGKLHNTQKVDSIVNFVNSIDSLSFLILNGNLTEFGEDDEIENLSNSISKLTHPFYALSGYRDLKWNKTAGQNLFDITEDFYFLHEIDSTVYIGINCNLPWITNCHIPVETISWLDDELENYTEEFEFIVFINKSTDKNIGNFDKLLKLFDSKKLAAIFSVNKIGAKFKPLFYLDEELVDTSSVTILSFNADSIFYQTVNIDSIISNERKSLKSKDEFVFETTETKIDTGINLIWKYDLNSTIYSNATFYNDHFYFADYSGIISCIDTLGNLIWDYDAFGYIVTKPAIADDILAIATLQGDLVTLNALTGESIQTIGFDESITFGLVSGNYSGTKTLMIPAKTKSAIYFGTQDGKVHCYILETLEKVWENKAANDLIALMPEKIGNKIFYTSLDGYLYCIDANEGWLIWKSKINTDKSISPVFSKFVFTKEYIFINDLSGKNYKINFKLGLKHWESEKYGANEFIGVSEKGHRVYLKNTERNFFNIISAKTGNWVKQVRMNLNDDEFSSKSIEWNENVLFTTTDGNLHLINKKFKDKIIYQFDNSPYHSIQNYKENYFLNTSLDGKIYFYKITGKY